MIIDEIAQIFGDVGDCLYYFGLSVLTLVTEIFDFVYVPISELGNSILFTIQCFVSLYLDLFGFLGDFWLVLFTSLFALYGVFLTLAIIKAIISFVNMILSLIPFY